MNDNEVIKVNKSDIDFNNIYRTSQIPTGVGKPVHAFLEWWDDVDPVAGTLYMDKNNGLVYEVQADGSPVAMGFLGQENYNKVIEASANPEPSPGDTSKTEPGGNPEPSPRDTSGTEPGGNPEPSPGDTSKTEPGGNPEPSPGDTSGTEPGGNPEPSPGDTSKTEPGGNPEPSPGDTSKTEPGGNPEPGSGYVPSDGTPNRDGYEYGYYGNGIADIIDEINKAYQSIYNYATGNTGIIKTTARQYWEGKAEQDFENVIDADAETYSNKTYGLFGAAITEINNTGVSDENFDKSLMDNVG